MSGIDIQRQGSILEALSASLIPAPLQSVCSTSLKLIENASPHQLSAAVNHSRNDVNKILAQLLAINFIAKNKTQIQEELTGLKLTHRTNAVVEAQSSNTVNTNIALEEYCQQKLLHLSPIVGFSRKNYFVEYNISDDIEMEIISFLKPIEIFKNITLINKQFNENVITMHASQKYNSVLDT